MIATATLSSKNQIVVPREAREALGVKAGDKLLIVVRGDTVIIFPRPKSFTKALAGLDKVASVIDDAKRYAQGRGSSLSAIVETYLKSVPSDKANRLGKTPVLRALKGILKRAGLSDYRAHLESKYR